MSGISLIGHTVAGRWRRQGLGVVGREESKQQPTGDRSLPAADEATRLSRGLVEKKVVNYSQSRLRGIRSEEQK
jgi:hypothetical protein